MMPLSIEVILLVLAVIFLSNTVETITGFAGTLLAMPFVMILIGVDNAKVVMNMTAILMAAAIVFQNRQYINWKQVAKMVSLMLAGMLIGFWLFQIMPLDFLLKVYGIMIILIALKNLLVKSKREIPNWGKILILIAAGIIHGMFVSGGALLVIYASAVLKDKHEFRATLEPVWIIVNMFMLLQQLMEGLFTRQNLFLILLAIVPLIGANFLGNKIHGCLRQETFLKLANLLLIVAGAALLC